MSDYLLCRVGCQEVAIPMACVEEVLQECEPKSVPGAPPWCAGLIQVRGEVLCGVDLAVLLFQEQAALRPHALVVCWSEGEKTERIVVLVERTLRVAQDASEDGAELPPKTPSGGRAVLADGVCYVVVETAEMAAMARKRIAA